MQPFRCSSADPSFSLAGLGVAHVTYHDSGGALRHAVEVGSDGTSVDCAELVAVLGRELDPESRDASGAVRAGGAGEDFHGGVDGGVEIVRWCEVEV